MDKTVQVPAIDIIQDISVVGPIYVTFEGREVGRRFRDRLKTAWAILRGNATHLYKAETTIMGCVIKGTEPLIEVG